MALTRQEQQEMERLELEMLEAEYAAAQNLAAPAPQAPQKQGFYGAESGMLAGLPKAGLPGTGAANEAAGIAIDAGLEGGGATAGQMIGAPFAPATFGLSVPIGGFIGGAGGNALAQMRRGGDFSVGEMVGAGVAGAIPGASLAKAPAKVLIKEGLKNSAGNLAAVAVEDVVNGAPSGIGRYAIAAGGGTVTPAVGKFTDAGIAAERTAKRALENKVRDETLAAARAAGYVIPPSKVNPSAVNNMLESFAGKADTAFEAVRRNQEVTNALAKKALGIPGEAPITEQVLRDVRAEASQPYRELADLGPAAAKDLDALKQARFDAKDLWAQYHKQGDPEYRKRAVQVDEMAAKLEEKLENRAMLAGRENLVPAMRESRKKIAQTYEVEKALNIATGDIEAPKLSRAIDRLTDDLELIARFQRAFPSYARAAATTPSPGVSKLRTFTPLFYGAAGYAGAGPAGMVAATIPLAEGPVRSGLLSSRFAKYMGQPYYGRGGADMPAEIGRFATMAASRRPQPESSPNPFMTPAPQF